MIGQNDSPYPRFAMTTAAMMINPKTRAAMRMAMRVFIVSLHRCAEL